MTHLYSRLPHLPHIVQQTGYADLRSLLLLHFLVAEIRPKCVIELGTGYGCSSIFMAWGCPHTKVISVDDYRGDTSPGIDVSSYNIGLCSCQDDVILVQGDSRDPLTMDLKAELVFLDASHNPDDLRAEIAGLQSNIHTAHVLVIDDIYSVNLDRFSFDLMKEGVYRDLRVLPFHNGVAVLNTCPTRFESKISKAVRRVYDE